MARLTRRDFLKASALGMGAVAISTGLAGCVLDSDDKRRVDFTHGVASGDPLQDSVILWTRAVPERGSKVKVGWEIATDAEFSSVVRSGTAETTEAHDFTIKVDAQGLMPGQRYYYRFRSSGATSPVGAATTLPDGSVEQVRLAVVSCSNYPAGYFHVYREVANQADLDAVIHLGDYIYEYSSDQDSYASEDAQALGRTFPENNKRELLTLADYRRRYAIYRQDPDLQLAHQRLPFIVVWDDHEVANDTWRNGAENHDDSEGDFDQRKLSALQAFFEWMPIRPVIEGNDEAIYRSFRFGDLVDLHMLDTRIIGRDQQLDYLNYLSESGLNAQQFMADVADPNRTLLGAEQRLWLQNKLATSSGRWQVLGQQVLMGRMDLPAELLLGIATGNVSELPQALAELATIKFRALQRDPTLTEQELSRINTAAPYNLDAWDGYQAEREVVLGMARQLDKNLVVLAGDTHNAWANNLKDMNGNQVGVEFATASVSSPGLEDYLGLPDAMIADAEQGIGLLVDGLDYLNINQRGYMVVTFTQDEALANWYFVDTVKSREYTVDSSRSAARKTLPGAGNRTVDPV
ncbi:alkaline phosphatase D family protein [Marinobacter nauticus]|uniref:alkaline phosphatase D family protein n=1 Tax=Marinobacter nauticus TaxID=2743 RepID=UPI001C95FF08|nr:alkaline phosphatase D family protein [Marinobacter nauticus]MBY6103792.1 alkaline phosphatase D family protein [Marinobacter nauticus]